jgi:hypothetical protein
VPPHSPTLTLSAATTDIFKFSSTPSNHAGIIKSGLHWGENEVFPYPVGDTTKSGEASRMIIAPMVGRAGAGRRQLYSCTTSTQSAFRPCSLVEDNDVFTVLLVNDGVISATSGSKMGQGFSTSVNLAPLVSTLLLTSGSVAVVNELSSAGYYSEVSALPVVSAATGWTFTIQVPAWSVISITLPTGAQTVTQLAPTGDASVFAGANAGTNYGAADTLSVGTSITEVHDTTSVAFIKFDASQFTAGMSSALLELSVASTSASGPSIMTVLALSPATADAWAEGAITWTGAGFALNATVAGVVSTVVNNFVRTDNGHSIAGHLTVNPGDVGVLKRVDVTDAVRAGGVVGFLIARRMRNSAYTGNYAPVGGIPADTLNGGDAVTFFSKESAVIANRPSLRVIVNGAPSAAPREVPAERPALRTHAVATAVEEAPVLGAYEAMSIASLHATTGEDGQCSSWESPYISHAVTIEGIVVAVFDGDGGIDGFVLQDDTAAFSGILVMLAAPEQVGLLATGAGFMPAMQARVRVEGIVGHVLGSPVLQQLSAVTLVHPRVPLPAAVSILTADLYAGCTLEGERYRNMVIQLNSVSFTINPDPTEISDAEYLVIRSNLSAYEETYTPNEDGELWLDDGTRPVQLDDKLFDVDAELGWNPNAACGVYLGSVLDSITGVAVFDDSQNTVSYELGNPSAFELNILNVTASRITPCPQVPAPPPAPVVVVPSSTAGAELTIAGINPATFNLTAVQRVLGAQLGDGAVLTVTTLEFPVAGAGISYTAVGRAAALAPATRTAVLRSLAASSAPALPSNVALAPARSAAGSRRSLLQAAPAQGTVAYTLAVSGSQSSTVAGAVAAAIAGFTHPESSSGLTAQLAMASVLASDVALVSQPTVSVRLNLAVVHPDVNASPQDALDAALTSGSLAAALTAAGVANTGVASSSDGQDDEPALSQLEKELIGGIIGAVFGAFFIALVRVKRLACSGMLWAHFARRAFAGHLPVQAQGERRGCPCAGCAGQDGGRLAHAQCCAGWAVEDGVWWPVGIGSKA